MRAPDADLVARCERAGGVDSIGNFRPGDSQPGPSYVQSVLFGKRRMRGTRPLPVPSPLVADGMKGDASRVAPELERN